MRAVGVAIISCVACGHATPAPPAPTPARVVVVDAGAPYVDPDRELASLLADTERKGGVFKTYAEAMAHLRPTRGPVPGEPRLTIGTVPDPTRCGGEDVIVTVDPKVPPNEPAVIPALAQPTPIGSTLAEIEVWWIHSRVVARVAVAYEDGKPGVEAAARRALVIARWLDVLLHDPFGRVDCDGAQSPLSGLFVDLDEARKKCRKAAADAGLTTGWWVAVCAP